MQPRVCLDSEEDRRTASASGTLFALAFVQRSAIDVQMIELIPNAVHLQLVVEVNHDIAEYFDRLL